MTFLHSEPTANSGKITGLGPASIETRVRAGRIPAAIALIAVDLAAIAAVYFILHYGVAAAPPALSVLADPHLTDLILFAGIILIGLRAASGAYPGFGVYPETRLRRNALAFVSAGLITGLAALHLLGLGLAALAALGAAFALAGLLQIAGAYITQAGLDRLGLWRLPVQIKGRPDAVRDLTELLEADRGFGYQPCRTRADTVIWAEAVLPGPDKLARLQAESRHIILACDTPRRPLSGIHPSRVGGELGVRVKGRQRSGAGQRVKRVFDFCFGLFFTILAAPFVLVAAIAIYLIDPGPVFYVQQREGQGGRKFGMLKLRTMYLDAERQLADLLARDPDARREWETHFKLRHDPRILPYVGTFLRKSSIDELPQFLNVLFGQMSLVGPRPFPEYHLEAMHKTFRKRRATVLPGVTGLWQVSKRSDADLDDQEALDDFYITGRGFWSDLSIITRTVSAILGQRGAY